MQNKNYSLPLSILTIGIIIAGGIFVSKHEPEQKELVVSKGDGNIIIEVSPVNTNDHIQGNPDAEIIVLEFSDFECPYCQEFHTTMQQIMNEYGQTGQVAWVYRHFPLTESHFNAYSAALASECAAYLGKKQEISNPFWQYADRVFSDIPVNLSVENLTLQAVNLGINESEFSQCLSDQKFAETVDQSIEDGYKLAEIDSEFATPYNLLISKSGIQTRISGSESYSGMKKIIDSLLAY